MGKASDTIKQGFPEGLAHVCGNCDAVRVYRPQPVDVKALRRRVR